MNITPSTEDRIWAAFSHLSSLALGMGILLPIISWSERRRKSNYAAFQSLQALGYQSLGYTVWLLSYLIAIIIVLIVLVAMSFQAGQTSQSFDPFFRSGAIFILFFIFGFFALYFLLPVIAAIACAAGKDFRYPILGDRLASYLAYDRAHKPEQDRWLNEDHEFRWVAAMGHFSILIMLWGMLVPLTTWMLHGTRSVFLKFQSIQTIVYQAGATFLYFVGMFIYLSGFLFLLAVRGVGGRPNFDSSEGMFGLLVFGFVSFISLVLILIVPFLHILGQWAGYRVLKGDNYRYPRIGDLVEKWIVNKKPLSGESSLGQTGDAS